MSPMKKKRVGDGGGPPDSLPPGFASLTSFNLKKLKPSSSNNNSQVAFDEFASLKKRPWILCEDHHVTTTNNNDTEQELQSEEIKMEQHLSTHSVPKGVVVLALQSGTTSVKGSKVDAFEDAPVFRPTEEEFADSLKYIASIRSIAEAFGICRIVPPPSWKPPCLLKEKGIWENKTFVTQIQRMDGLQDDFLQSNMASAHKGRFQRKNNFGTHAGGTIDPKGVEGSESLLGPEFTLKMFEKYSDELKHQYFRRKGSKLWEPSMEDIRGACRRILENPTAEIKVLYCDDLDSRIFGSGFPSTNDLSSASKDNMYLNSSWNLNCMAKLPGNLLCFESSMNCNILVPRIKIGMCFSSFPWKVEDHHLYCLCYMHLGAPKAWYGIPGRYNAKFTDTMKKNLSDLFVGEPNLHDMLLAKLSPSKLKSEGIPGYRCVQGPGEFILVLPGAYYSGFNCGFNCAEAVNVAPLCWLPHGQHVVELYSLQGKKTCVSYDMLLLGAAKEAVKAQWEMSILSKCTPVHLKWKATCGKEGILTKALKSRIRLEANRRKYLVPPSQSQKMDKDFNATSKKECSICLYDLHLSAVRCKCCSDRYSCLIHAELLCSCAWSEKTFLFRYEMSELNLLIEALEGKLTAVYRWARQDLNLTLESHVRTPGEQNEVHGSKDDEILNS